MPSTCPKCHRVVAEDVVCCSGLVFFWRCTSCHKVSSGLAVPYGRCFMCGGELRTIPGRHLETPLAMRPIRDALQFELNAHHFYRLALARATDPALRSLFEHLHESELEHLHTIQERYHAHLDPEVIELSPSVDALLASELFRDINLADPLGGPAGLYEKAIEMERRTLRHFRLLADELPEGEERQICLELAAEEEEHVAMLETERDQLREDRPAGP